MPVQVTEEGKVVAVGDGPEGDYLPITGGNLTGDLTLGTDKIELNTNGSASFAGGVEINTDGDIGTYIGEGKGGALNPGFFITKRDVDGTGDVAYVEGNAGTLIVKGDGALDINNANILLKANGSASFASGDIKLDTASNFNGIRVTSPNAGDAFVSVGIDSEPEWFMTSRYDASSLAGTGWAIRYNGNNKFTVDSAGDVKIGGAANETVDVNDPNIYLKALDGSAKFAGDVVIGSRGTQWLIRESNGVAMLIEQSRRGLEPRMQKVRDLPNELDLIEAALSEVMAKLKMVPPAGWPVWDGQSEATTDNDNA